VIVPEDTEDSAIKKDGQLYLGKIKRAFHRHFNINKKMKNRGVIWGEFDGKVVLITGGSRGMGAAHARAFVKEGAKVAITDILVEEGEKLSDELGEQVKFYKHDVSISTEWEAIVADIEETSGPINVLVNNAGVSLMKPILEMSEEEYRRVIDINQVSVFIGMKTVIPSMLKTKDGSIINISSLAGFRGTVDGSVPILHLNSLFVV